MKPAALLISFCVYFNASAQMQRRPAFDKAIGSYELNFSKATRFNIVDGDSLLYIHVIGQGKVPVREGTDGRYVVDIVQPQATIEFLDDSNGKYSKFLWRQEQRDFTWTRAAADSTLQPDTASSPFAGKYELPGSALPIFIKQNAEGTLRSLVFGETPLIFKKHGDTAFEYRNRDFLVRLSFHDLKDGKYQKIDQKRSGFLEFVRLGTNDDDGYFKTIPNTKTGFSRTDSLQGMLTPLRTCYDVNYYNLDLTLNPSTRQLSGTNKIHFRVTEDFSRMQIDLVRNMKITAIKWKNRPLSWTRELNAVYINFPQPLKNGSLHEISIEYNGQPQPADLSTLSGGFLWMHDRNGNDWIEVVTQGTGASVWWPCKDHLSDEPDSMQINVTLPKALKNISNGRLRKQTPVGDTAIRSEWFVSYPINTYNVTLNIGDYQRLSDKHINGKDTLDLSFYYLPYNRRHADTLLAELKKMLKLNDRFSGPYPFKRDGLTVMEAPYPMEHQGAVSIGSINEPIFSSVTNIPALTTMVWHEVGHEWWGNSVSVSDNADIWFHEAFATYLEIMGHEAFKGRQAAIKKLYSDMPSNNEKMVGEYDVNHFKLNSVYTKGAWMLHTLRSIVDNDSSFFGLLRGIQQEYGLKTINSDTIINYVGRYTSKPLRPFFEQYLYHAAIPKLEMKMDTSANGNVLLYRWKTDVTNFWMPVRLLLPGNRSLDIVGTNTWNKTNIGNIRLDEIKLDKDSFYVE
ncbi:MAG: hypothetical protein EOO04_14260 [Chitinophagaceae bacterium]|nr:MAG: hypothetical protein EOO04_14260 [Chitinophagaceae bacterium]